MNILHIKSMKSCLSVDVSGFLFRFKLAFPLLLFLSKGEVIPSSFDMETGQ